MNESAGCGLDCDMGFMKCCSITLAIANKTNETHTWLRGPRRGGILAEARNPNPNLNLNILGRPDER